MNLFRQSLEELKDLKNVAVCGMLIALSMAIETFTIQLGFAKINFAFLAIAAIGMLYGGSVSFFCGGICDILGYLVHPDGAFFPLYTLIGAVQGLIYGVIAYRKLVKNGTKELTIRLIIARIVDVLFINLVCNTAANYHYGFLQDRTLGAAIIARVSKNLLELPIDLVLISVVLIAVMKAYETVFGKQRMTV